MDKYDTRRFTFENAEKSSDALDECARLIREGELVGLPTETVYGLGANALDEAAVKEIFNAKGRPQDNPLIVHIADPCDMDSLFENVSNAARKLADAFWPGPMTIVMKKKPVVPDAVSAGLDTVAVRCPSHECMREIIRRAGVPIAAPSANLSGRPSPTCAQHVLDDLDGRIAAVIDGGACEVGLESTVIDLSGDVPFILRPGAVTCDDVKKTVGSCDISHHVLECPREGEKVRSPGMKYRHYAPKAEVVLVKGENTRAKMMELMEADRAQGVITAAMCYTGEEDAFLGHTIYSLGARDRLDDEARLIFALLREMDKTDIERVYIPMPDGGGIGLALQNRLVRAAAFRIVDAE